MDGTLTPDTLLAAYSNGIFPMADPDAGDQIFWYAPDPRAILPLEGFRISRSLRSRIRRKDYETTTDLAFEEVIRNCASRDETWISEEIERAYIDLFRLGFAHSVEAWLESDLVGGLYGVAIHGAFFGESMFSIEPDASKVALVYLVEKLRQRGFELLDIQFMTEHLRRFGAMEIPKIDYEDRLCKALAVETEWI